MALTLAPDISPTGTPLIPPTAVPWIAMALGLIPIADAIVSQAIGHPTILGNWLHQLATYALPLGGILGVASPGLRKSDGGA